MALDNHTMKIIDSHTHISFGRQDFHKTAEEAGVDFTLQGLKKEMEENDVESAIAITANRAYATPLEYAEIMELVVTSREIIGVFGINPTKISEEGIEKIDEALFSGLIKGLKIYAGYWPIYPTDEVYHKFYELAERHDVPVIIHTGDIYEKGGLLKYSHPLNVDEAAVEFPNVKFVIAHLGCPWFIDAAAVAYKNDNVFADLSGLFIGGSTSDAAKRFAKKGVRDALDYLYNYDKILYGSDWPLVRMDGYIDFIKGIVPEEHHQKVFYDNAKRLFKLGL